MIVINCRNNGLLIDMHYLIFSSDEDEKLLTSAEGPGPIVSGRPKQDAKKQEVEVASV